MPPRRASTSDRGKAPVPEGSALRPTRTDPSDWGTFDQSPLQGPTMTVPVQAQSFLPPPAGTTSSTGSAAASQQQQIPRERRGRGPGRGRLEPRADPAERFPIRPEYGRERFEVPEPDASRKMNEHKDVVREIACILKNNLPEAAANYSSLPAYVKDQWDETFMVRIVHALLLINNSQFYFLYFLYSHNFLGLQQTFRWEPQHHERTMLIFRKKMRDTFKDLMFNARCSGKKPQWIGLDVWTELGRIWGTEEFGHVRERQKTIRGLGPEITHSTGRVSHIDAAESHVSRKV